MFELIINLSYIYIFSGSFHRVLLPANTLLPVCCPMTDCSPPAHLENCITQMFNTFPSKFKFRHFTGNHLCEFRRHKKCTNPTSHMTLINCSRHSPVSFPWLHLRRKCTCWYKNDLWSDCRLEASYTDYTECQGLPRMNGLEAEKTRRRRQCGSSCERVENMDNGNFYWTCLPWCTLLNPCTWVLSVQTDLLRKVPNSVGTLCARYSF